MRLTTFSRAIRASGCQTLTPASRLFTAAPGLRALLLSFLVLTPGWSQHRADSSEPLPPPRYPAGVYAVVPVETAVAGLPATGDFDTNLQNFYTGLLNTTAVSGLALQVYWDTLNHSSSTDHSNWNYLDDAFASVSAWNSANGGQPPMTIQLELMPGFNSPQWELKKLASCNFLFDHAALATNPSSACGKVTFSHISEPHLYNDLPMPWNSTYKTDWKTFLTAINAKYGSNPSLVSIAVAGPTASSVEINVPHDQTVDEFGNTYSDVTMWAQLLTNAGKSGTDDSEFISEWEAAVDMFAGIFSGLTLVVTPADGLPELGGSYTTPGAFTKDCMHPSNMDCGSEAQILVYLMKSTVGGYNGKAVQTSGLKGSRTKANLGIDGVRTITTNTMTDSAYSTLVLGGGQFTTSFSNYPVQEGCTSVDPSECAGISPEQAFYNVLALFFDGTAASPIIGPTPGSTPGIAPLNYLQLYYPDIQYAATYASSKAMVTQTDGSTISESAQTLLSLASAQLSSIGEGEPVCPKGVVCSH